MLVRAASRPLDHSRGSATVIIPSWDSRCGWVYVTATGIVTAMDAKAGTTCHSCRGLGWRWVRFRRSTRPDDIGQPQDGRTREACWHCGGTGERAIMSQEGAA
ncbi:hypothetical protein GCM10023405_51020 [Streptomonospora salina]